MPSPGILGVDVGGTFTDLVLVQQGRIQTVKVLSTADPDVGVFQALAEAGVAGTPDDRWDDPEDPKAAPDHQDRQPQPSISIFCHGMTVATNALLERQGVPTVFLTTAGFRDILAIGRQNRPALYDLTQPKPPLLILRDHVIGVRERCTGTGVIEALTDAEIQRVLGVLKPLIDQAGIQSVAVGLLFSFLYPDHELQLGQAIRQAFPDLHVSLSCEVTPEFREYERFSTTAIDAYLSPLLARYLHRLSQGCHTRGLPEPLIMQSSGGVTTVAEAADHASVALLSGPAGGVSGAAYLGRQAGFDHLLTLDMGGTSTDVALIQGGEPQLTTQAVLCGYPVQHPQIDLHTVSAGGGSIAALVAGGGLQVGPRSAGSVPGPACYGRGGTVATVTDANLWLGYLPDGGILGGSVHLQRELAEQAIRELADPLGLDVAAVAVGIRQLANGHMARALRVISVERGLDPAGFALMAFGGAGPMHACALAEALGIQTILLPLNSGVLSALGMALSNLRRDYRRAILQPLDQIQKSWIQRLDPLIEQATRDLQDPQLTVSLDLRYLGQSFELTLPILQHCSPDQLTLNSGSLDQISAQFHQAHQQRYGWHDLDQPLEWVHLRLSAIQALPAFDLPKRARSSDPILLNERQAWFNNGFETVPVYAQDAFCSDQTLTGPAILEMEGATAVIDPTWCGTVTEQGVIVVSRSIMGS